MPGWMCHCPRPLIHLRSVFVPSFSSLFARTSGKQNKKICDALDDRQRLAKSQYRTKKQNNGDQHIMRISSDLIKSLFKCNALGGRYTVSFLGKSRSWLHYIIYSLYYNKSLRVERTRCVVMQKTLPPSSFFFVSFPPAPAVTPPSVRT